MKFSEKIRQLRIQQSKSQKSAADYAGITRRTYIAYECEGRYPQKREVYCRLAEFFGVDLNYLLSDDEAPANAVGTERVRADVLLAELSELLTGGELTEGDREDVISAVQKICCDCREGDGCAG